MNMDNSFFKEIRLWQHLKEGPRQTNKPRKNFLVWWTLATIIAWCIFLPMYMAVFGGFNEFLEREDATLFHLLRMYIGVSFVIGVCQWYVLRQYLHQAGWWILATVGGTSVGVILRWFMSDTTWLLDLIFIFPIVGIFQWLYLWHETSVSLFEALLWVLIKGISFAGGLILYMVILFTSYEIIYIEWLESLSTPWYETTVLSMAIIVGLIFGLSSGIHLKTVLERGKK